MDAAKKVLAAERIQTRRLRVEAKRNKGGATGPSSVAATAAPKAISKSKAQITASRQHVDDTKRQAEELITDVVVERDHQENVRRRREEERRQERWETKEREKAEAADANMDIESRWPEVSKKNIPEELYQEILQQFEAQSKLIAGKTNRIKSLKEEQKNMDAEYVELLEQHRKDTQTMIERMQEQFNQLVATHSSELETTENKFLEERNDWLEANKREMDELFTRRRDMELGIMDAKQKREEHFQNDLSKIRSRDAEDYNTLKITLENNLQLLEQQLEEMRSTYQLNQEKLEYNHDVLSERTEENKTTLDHQYKRIKRLTQALMSIKRQCEEQDKKFADENQALTEDYKRITEQFKDLQRKYRHFETIDNRKYRDVWEMNEEHVMKVVRKVLKADHLIHEQVMGLQWVPPEGVTDIDKITSAQIVHASDTEVKQLSGTAKLEETAALMHKGKYTKEQIAKVMDLLMHEASFLVDARVLDTVRTMKEDEARLYKADAVLTALGVDDREDLDELVGFFFIDETTAEPTLDANEVVDKVREFVVRRQQSKTKTGGGIVIKTESVSAEKKARKKERERKFWKKLGHVISDQTSDVWSALERAQRKYNSLLEDRQGLINETQELARQNAELKVLLQEYLHSKINQELHIPPTLLARTVRAPVRTGHAMQNSGVAVPV